MAPLFLLLLFLLSLSLSLVAVPDPISGDEDALLAFKRSISSDPSGLLSAWSPAVGHHCSWRGVSCANSGRVTSLKLTSSFLAGTLTPVIADLTDLRFFAVPSNYLSGEIPPAVGKLRRLELLDLSNNNFSGKIPFQLATLPALRVLDLSANSLSGAIPEALVGGSRLESLNLSSNHLAGKIAVSSSNQCRFLVHLNLSNNFLVDKIPPELGKCSKLRTLLLNGNILEGRIPAELGRLPALQVLDVSRNSLTDRIPKELGNCTKLSVLILTDVADSMIKFGNEFNSFVGGIPRKVFAIPNLEVLWAPRANLDGRLPEFRRGSCKLRTLNLGQNYISGSIPEWFGYCKSFSFLDLSSNNLQGFVPVKLGVQCIAYLNFSRNSLSGTLQGLPDIECPEKVFDNNGSSSMVADLVDSYAALLIQYSLVGNLHGSVLNQKPLVLHDFSWNGFVGELPSFSVGFAGSGNSSYGLLLNNNAFNGSFPGELFRSCRGASNFVMNLSSNQLSGEIGMFADCWQMKSLELADNRLEGSIPADIGNLSLLSYLDLRGNQLNGSIPDQLGGLNVLQELYLSGNHISGEIPAKLGGMVALTVLDLSKNSLTGSIPSSLTSASKLEKVLLDHNKLSGIIPQSFCKLIMLTTFDVSFNNLSGSIPAFEHIIGCDFFMGNLFLQPCKNANASSPSSPPSSTGTPKSGSGKSRLKSFEIAAVASASAVVCILLVLVLYVICGKRKLLRIASLRRKVVVTFTDAPSELSYDNVVRATGNFSIQNLIGTGGFGATYKAELVPGFLIAVKRLSIGRFQGLKQFDAEIRTLGRIRHKNLVTLIGYHMSEADTFLIYNFLSGGNLETFINDMSQRDVKYPIVHKIALDVAQALAYLHYSCVPRIVHRDIKPSNILLDEKLNAYLSDFGLARLLEVSETHATTDVAGTFGYVAPEYATTCRVSDKADVYSFGVVLLELMSGKRSLDPSFSDYGNGFTIVAWGRLLIQEGRSGELFVPSLWEAGPKENLVSILRLALACTVESLSVRPSMKQVVETLKHLRS